jgi:hypothetical protein
LIKETQASGDARHDKRNKVVEVTICWCRELECSEANVVRGLAIDTESIIRVLYELVNRESGVVRLRDRKL